MFCHVRSSFLTGHFLKLVMILLALLGFGILSPAAASPSAQDDAEIQAKIESAMSAAPMSISQEATIFDRAFDADGNFVVLREGTNGWYCLPDLAASPGNDPVCYDQTWIDAIYAFRAGEPVNIPVPGIAYMLQGGSHASYTDPAATQPAEGDDWENSGPHLMILLPSTVDLSGVGTDTDMSSGNSFVMFPGTALAHLMVPVGDMAPMTP